MLLWSLPRRIGLRPQTCASHGLHFLTLTFARASASRLRSSSIRSPPSPLEVGGGARRGSSSPSTSLHTSTLTVVGGEREEGVVEC